MKLTAIHIITEKTTSFFLVTDSTRFFWSNLLEGMDFGWHTIERPQLITIIEKLKKEIDELVAIDSTVKLKREIQYGGQRIKLSPTSAEHSKAIPLILLYNSIAVVQSEIHVLLMPSYNSFHEQVFKYLKQKAMTSIDNLIDQFGDKVITVIDDFRQIGLVNVEGDQIHLTELTTEISFLAENKGSASLK